MATTKKSTKGRKKSRKYMKRAARRTLAALLMITALIVAAIPATPSSAATGPDGNTYDYVYIVTNTSNPYCMYFKNNLPDGIQFVGFDSITVSESTITVSGVQTTATSISIKQPTVETEIDIPDEMDAFTSFNQNHIEDNPVIERISCTDVVAMKNVDKITKFTCDTLNQVNDGAFSNGIKLTEFNSESVTKVGKNAFNLSTGDSALSTFRAPKTSIVDDYSFMNCKKLDTITLAPNVTKIGSKAFYNCKSMTSFPVVGNGSVDPTLDSMGESAFEGSGLNGDITIPGPETIGGDLALASRAFAECSDIGEVTLSEGYTTIGDGAFNNCSLSYIKFPSTLKTVGNGAFDKCTRLAKVEIPEMQTPNFFSSNPTIFNTCTNLKKISLINNKTNSNLKMDTGVRTYFPLTSEGHGYKPNDGFYIEGYRYLADSTSTDTDAYKYCRYYGIPYRCLDDEAKAIQDKFFTVTDDNKLIEVDVDSYFNRNINPYLSDDYTLIIPSSVSVNGPSDADKKTTEIKSIANSIFDKSTDFSKIKKIIVDSNETDHEMSIEDEAFKKLTSLEIAEFTMDSVSFGGSNIFPDGMTAESGNPLLIISNLVDENGALNYAMDNNYLFRGKDADDVLDLYVKVYSNSSGTYKNTLYRIEDDTNVTYKGGYNDGTLSLPSGVHYIEPDYIKGINSDAGINNPTSLVKFSSEGLVKIFEKQFEYCTGLTEVELPSSLAAIENEPFLGCNALDPSKFSIDGSEKCAYEDGVIFAPFNKGDDPDLPDAGDGSEMSLVQMLPARTLSYTMPNSIQGKAVSRIRPGAFRNTFVNTSSGSFTITDGSSVSRIPRECFVGSKIAKFYFGSSVKYGNADDSFKNLEHLPGSVPKFYIYNDGFVWPENADKTFDYIPNSTSDAYYFVCNDGSNTQDFTDKRSSDNLVRLDEKLPVSEDPVDLKDATITVITKVTSINPEWKGSGDPGEPDFNVYVNGTIVDPENYRVIIENEASLSRPGSTISFHVDGIRDKGFANSTKSETFKIEGESDDPLADHGFEIRFLNEKDTFEKYVDLVPKDKYSDTGEDGEYIVWNPSTGEVLRPFTDYKPRLTGRVTKTDMLIVDGKGSKYEGGILERQVTIKGDEPEPTPPGPTPPTPGTLVLRKITYPETSDGDQTRLYANGREYVMSPGYDFIVYGSDDKVVDPGEYKVEVPSGSKYTTDGKNLIGVKGDPEKTIEIPFTVETPGNPSSNYAKSSIAGKFIIIPKEENDGDFNIKLPGIDDLGFAEWTGGVIEPEPVVYLKTDSSTILEVIKHYTVGYPDTDDDSGPNNKDMGTNKGVVYIYGADGTKYAGKSGRRYFSIRKSIPYYVTSDDNRKKITFTVTNGRYYTGEGEIKVDEDVDDSTTKKEEGKYSKGTVNADVVLTDATTGKKLVEGVDYTLSFKKEKGMNGTVTVTGMGNYFGSYTSAKFPLKKESKSSSSSSGGGSSSNSSSNKSSSSSSSSRSSSSSMGGSSSSSGTGSSSGANRNSGTTVINRNYYGPNGGTVDELQDMLRAAHIDSINGGTADGYQVNITKSDAAEQAFRDALIRRYGSLDNIRYFSMDISVRDQNGNPIDTSGMSVTLTLPLPTSMQQYGTNNKIATVDSAGDLEDLNEQFSTLEGRPCVTFVAPHFSPYGFYVNTADLAIGTLDNTPKTGDPIHPKWFLSFGLAALSIFLFLKRDPKPRVSAA